MLIIFKPNNYDGRDITRFSYISKVLKSLSDNNLRFEIDRKIILNEKRWDPWNIWFVLRVNERLTLYGKDMWSQSKSNRMEWRTSV